MSRFAIAFSLIASLTTAALADRVSPPSWGKQLPAEPSAPIRFAHPPGDAPSAEMPVGNSIRVDRAAVRAKLARMRTANLARFRVYQKKGVFPNNTYSDGKLNVWKDAFGNFCAAATIIRLSGQTDLVDSVADQNNFIRLADVTQGPLMDWILTSGLTQAEIAAIQEPMMPVVREPNEPSPEPIIVDARMRQVEDLRLMVKYKQVEKQILKNAKKSLDAATDRLMENPTLASQFLNG